MKKICTYCLIMFFCLQNSLVFAQESQNTQEVNPPVWEEYVPEKYENPRDFSRGKSIAELSGGILLTELLITAPIGIPMIVHSTTKLKNKGYYDRKLKFEQGLLEAEKISDPEEKEMFYKNLLKECKLTEEMRQKQQKRIQKKKENAQK